MNADMAHAQRIGRLTPLVDVLAMIDAVAPVAPVGLAVAEAAGGVVAADVVAPVAVPAETLALRDGWAVPSDATRDAGPYSPMPLDPKPQRVDAFAPLPGGTDAVAPLDAIMSIGGMMQAMAPVAPGEGALPAGGNAEAGTVLVRAGARLRGIDVAALAAAGVSEITIRRPRIRVVNAKAEDALLDAAVTFVADALRSAGVAVMRERNLDAALTAENDDALIVIGGTGSGRGDRSVIALSQAGSLASHGIGLSPGETAAFGHANKRPVLLIPGRIDSLLAAWLTLGRRLVDRLSGVAAEEPIATTATLGRKVASTIGLAEIVPVRLSEGQATPLASGFLTLQSIARADGWILVPADSEGYPAGTGVDVRPLP